MQQSISYRREIKFMDDTNDDTNYPTPDDALEPVDDIFNPAVDEAKLEGDYDPPAAPAASNAHQIPLDHPITDSGLDESEVYGEGLGEATDVDKNEILPDERPKPLEPED